MVSRTSAAPPAPTASVSVRLRQQLFVGQRDRPPVEGDLKGAGEDAHQPVELAGRQHAARAATDGEQPVDLQVALLDLHARRARRVGDQRGQRAVERRLGAAGGDQHAREPQSVDRAREPIADAREAAVDATIGGTAAATAATDDGWCGGDAPPVAGGGLASAGVSSPAARRRVSLRSRAGGGGARSPPPRRARTG